MNKSSYAEKLRDPRWQKKRLEVMHRADFACEECSDKENTLHVHHCLYVTGKEPWDYPISELRCLCERCHDERGSIEHDTFLEWRRMCARLTIEDLQDLMHRILSAKDALEEKPRPVSLTLELICDMARYDWNEIEKVH